MALTIQSFSPEHAQGVAELIVPIQQNEFGVDINLDAQPDLKDIPGYYQHGQGDFWVAVEDGKVVGSISLLDIGNNQSALRKMFVAESHRGGKGGGKGVAHQLLEVALAHARIKGVAEIFLGTTVQFLAAHRFYEKNGFHLIDAETLPASFPRMEVDTRFYRLAL